MRPPAYFKRIRHDASELWDQLECKPELAGPWHQLFRQVQSPRHVVSELLQNADDAGATEATVEINSGEFIFSHNGQDFNEEQFASLCRFGFSNKRTLHTIGFRGVGFKSTLAWATKYVWLLQRSQLLFTSKGLLNRSGSGLLEQLTTAPKFVSSSKTH